MIIAVFAKTIGSLAEKPAMRLGAPLAAMASTVLFPVASFLLGQSSMAGGALSLVAAAIMGASGSCIIIMWAERASAAGARNSMLVMNVSLVLSGLLYFVVSLWPPEAVTVVASALPCLSGGLLAFGAGRLSPAQAQGCDSGSDRGFEPARPHLKILAPLTISFFCALCGEMYRNLITMAHSDAGFVTMGLLYAVGGGVGALLLGGTMVVLRLLGKSDGENAAVRLVLAVMVIGYLVSMVYDGSIFIGYAFFCAVFGGIRLLSWMFSARIVQDGRRSPLRVFAISLSSFSLPVALSATFMEGLTASISNGVIPWTTVAATIIAILFFVAILILDPRDIRTNWDMNCQSADDEGEAPSEAAPSVASRTAFPSLDYLREEAGLTNRELEVARLLYQGRSIPFIQNELCIAEGTATTRLRHIYRKLDVHTRQEFISAIQEHEARSGADRPSEGR